MITKLLKILVSTPKSMMGSSAKILKYGVALSLLLVVACQPEDIPEPTSGPTVFNISGGGIDIVAGEDDFYLFTSYGEDSTGVFQYVSSFEKLEPDCDTSCQEYFRIIIRDESSSTLPVPNINTVLNANLSYAGSLVSSVQQLSYDMQLSTNGVPPLQVRYRLNDEPFLTSVNLTDTTIERSLANPLNKVFMEATDAVGCVSSIERVFDNTGLPDLNVEITTPMDTVIFDSLLLIASATGMGVFDYVWENSGNTSDTNFVAFFPALFNEAKVTVNNANSSATAGVGVYSAAQPGNGNLICNTNLDISLDTITVANPDLITVTLEYRASNGTIYRSDELTQPADSFFDITNVSSYFDNENGETTKKMTVNFNCPLRSTTGFSINITGGSGVIAIAHPE
ncbi:MAG: hypothetical protein AB8G15_22170 [Saprospiraceae bacterium]